MRNLIEDILHERRNDLMTLPVRCILRFFAFVYYFVITIRNTFYNWGALKTFSVPCRVVSIGNIVAGGTGKTPVVIMTVRFLQKAGLSCAVVSRGYERSGKGITVVSDGQNILVSPQESGDEPHIIADSLKGVPVVVGNNRYRAALLAGQHFHPDIIVLDDAFQHRRLHRDVDIVAMDADNPFGSGNLLPRGLLREPPSALKRAHAVIITRIRDDRNRETIERIIRQYNRMAPIFLCKNTVAGLRKPGSSEIIPSNVLQGKKIAAISNIANPDSFHRILETLGAKIVYTRIMQDHHRYENNELDEIKKLSLESGAELLVMTAKDERNLPADSHVLGIENYVLDIEAELIGEVDEYIKLIVPKIRTTET